MNPKIQKISILSVSLVSLLFFIMLNNAFPWPIPDSGQTTCYNLEKEIPCPKSGEPFYGQDANYNINPPSYTKLDVKGNDLPDDATSWVMVRDNVTGLRWEVKTEKDDLTNYNNPHDADNIYTWYDTNLENNYGYTGTAGDGTDTEDFIHALNAEAFGSYTDWRIPDSYELGSLFALSQASLNNGKDYFPNMITDYFWSKDSYDKDPSEAYSTHFHYVDDYRKHKSEHLYIRAVRGEKPRLKDHLVENQDNTVTDISTGLMWQKETHSTKIWSEALNYCETLKLGGYLDWRLPGREELRSIALNTPPYINSIIFSDTLSTFYWSFMSNYTKINRAYGINFKYGHDVHSLKEAYEAYAYRAVRGGQNQLSDHLIILSPKQASKWETGETMPIHWLTKDISGNVRILISRDGGKEGTFDIITESTVNDGKFDWLINSSGSVNCMLRIEPVGMPNNSTQQGLFMITDFVPQQLSSLSHTTDICSNLKTIDIEWLPPQVWGRGILGYSILWDHSPDILPDKQLSTTKTSHSRSITGKDLFVHIRVVDDNNHWSNTAAHLGPFCNLLSNVSTPSGLTVSSKTNGHIDIKWYPIGDGIYYNVYRSDSKDGFYIQCDPYMITKPEYTDTEVTDGMTYWYKISASNANGEESSLSDPVSSTSKSDQSCFQLIPFQTQQMQIAGLSAYYPIQVLPIGNYAGNVQLWIVNLHSWINYKFDKQILTPPGFVTLELHIPDTLESGNYQFKVVAMGNNSEFEQLLTLDIVNPVSNESTISAYVKKNPVRMNTPVQIYGNIQPSRVNTHLFIDIQYESEDVPIVKETMTNNTSRYQLDFIPQQTGTYHINARWDGDESLKGCKSTNIHLTALRGKAKLSCTTPDKDISPDSTINITGQLLPELSNAAIIIQKINPDGVSDILENRIFTDESGKYQYSIKLDMSGIWEIKTCWKGNDQYQGVVSSPLRLYPGIKAGKILIIAGGGKESNNLWNTISYLTTRFYRILLNRQCTPDMIHYISPDQNFQDDLVKINDTTPSVADIETYIRSLYHEKTEPDVNPDRPLVIYMVDHGGNGTFKVNYGLETLKAQDLDHWLDDLQAQTFCPVYIIIEACYSGTFTDVLFPDSSQKRVIITSTGNYVARYESEGRQSFSQYLLNGLSQGYNLKHCFYETIEAMHPQYIFKGQIPQLVDGNNDKTAETSYIGGSFLIGDLLPEIISHTLSQTISAGAFNLFADISDIEGINRVWVSIMPPNFHLPETAQNFETPVINLPTIDLQDTGNGHYAGEYLDFIINGIYRVTLYCEDSFGNVVSKEILLNVMDGKTIINGDLDSNGRVNISDAILSLQWLSGLPVPINENGRILCGESTGACEVIHILQIVSGI